jgi:hypothetical protein
MQNDCLICSEFIGMQSSGGGNATLYSKRKHRAALTEAMKPVIKILLGGFDDTRCNCGLGQSASTGERRRADPVNAGARSKDSGGSTAKAQP